MCLEATSPFPFPSGKSCFQELWEGVREGSGSCGRVWIQLRVPSTAGESQDLSFQLLPTLTSGFFSSQGPQGEPGPPGQQGNPGAQVRTNLPLPSWDRAELSSEMGAAFPESCFEQNSLGPL